MLQKILFAVVWVQTTLNTYIHTRSPHQRGNPLLLLIILLSLLLNSCSFFKNYQLEKKIISNADCSKLYMYHEYEKKGNFWYKSRHRSHLQIKQDSIISFSMSQILANPNGGYVFLDRYTLGYSALNLKTLQFDYSLVGVSIPDIDLCEKEIMYPLSHHNYTFNFIDSVIVNGIKLYISNGSLEKNIIYWECEKYGYILGFNTSDSMHCQSYLADTFDENHNKEVQNLLDSIYVNYYHLPGFEIHEKVFDIDRDVLEGIGKVRRADFH